MANITRYDPFSELSPFAKDFFKNSLLHPLFRTTDLAPDIRLDVSEDVNTYLITAEIPGVSKEDIKISVDGNQVAISAEVKKETEEKDGKHLIRSERYHGMVSRSFSLDENVDYAAAQAKYQDGVLKLILPKKPAGNSRTIKVS